MGWGPNAVGELLAWKLISVEEALVVEQCVVLAVAVVVCVTYKVNEGGGMSRCADNAHHTYVATSLTTSCIQSQNPRWLANIHCCIWAIWLPCFKRTSN
jgi:hypothetical protein